VPVESARAHLVSSTKCGGEAQPPSSVEKLSESTIAARLTVEQKSRPGRDNGGNLNYNPKERECYV